MASTSPVPGNRAPGAMVSETHRSSFLGVEDLTSAMLNSLRIREDLPTVTPLPLPIGAKRASAPQPAVRELGHASAGSVWGMSGETTPELAWPLSIQVYDAMRRQDAQVISVLRAVTLPIRRTRWRIEPNGARPEVVALVAGDLGLPVLGQSSSTMGRRSRGRFSWDDHLRQALLMLVYGHMFFEQIYRIDENTGSIHLRKLGPRMPDTLEEIKADRDGGLLYIKQRPEPHAVGGHAAKDATIPVSRLVAYVHEREGGNWHGTSLLRQAYKNWMIKDRLLRTQTQAIDRNGMGIPVYEGPPDGSEDDLRKGGEIATELRSGDNSGAAIPHGAKLRLMGVEGKVPDADAPIRYHDEQIARAVLAHFLNLGTQTGSWALGSTFADFFTQSLQAVAQDVAAVTTAHVIEDLVDLNYGTEEPAPRLVFDEIGTQATSLAQSIRTLVDSGALKPDPQLETHLRRLLDLPEAPTQGVQE